MAHKYNALRNSLRPMAHLRSANAAIFIFLAITLGAATASAQSLLAQPFRAVSDGGAGSVRKIFSTADDVIMTGTFSGIDNGTASNFARLDSSGNLLPQWSVAVHGPVDALISDGADLYLGGGGGLGVDGIIVRGWARMNGPSTALSSSQSPSDVYHSVYSLLVDGNHLYVGGSFGWMGGARRSNVARIDKQSGASAAWNPAPNGSVDVIVKDAGRIYVGGRFSRISSVERDGIAIFDGVSGELIGVRLPLERTGGNSPSVSGVAATSTTLFVQGKFSSSGSVLRRDVAAFSKATGALLPWDPQANGSVDGVLVSDNHVFIYGNFSSVQGQPRRGIAAFDLDTGQLSSWNLSLDTTWVFSAATLGNSLVIAGTFSTVLGVPRQRVARVTLPSTVFFSGFEELSSSAKTLSLR